MKLLANSLLPLALVSFSVLCADNQLNESKQVNGREDDSIVFKIPSAEIKAAGISSIYPQLFIFDKDRRMLFHKKKVTRDLRKYFRATDQEHSNSKAKTSILSLVPLDHDFAAYDYTLIFIGDADAIHGEHCPPCLTQSKINTAVLNKIQDLNIFYINIEKVSKGNRITEMMSKEEFERRFGVIE